jgi:hypothetical protein
MLRPVAAAAVAVLLLASCGDDDDEGPAAAGPRGVSGTVMGQPFTAADTGALPLSAATCSFEGFDANATGLLLGFGSFPGLCSFVTQNQGCATKADATIVNVLLVRANVLGGDPGPVRAGTFTIGATSQTPDAQGNVTVAQALLVRSDASCGAPANVPAVTSGTVRLTSVGARVAGSVDLSFSDGGRVAGNFDVPACGFQTDVCTALAGGDCPTDVCVP